MFTGETVLADTHCHLTDEQFGEEVEAVIERARGEGITRILTLGTDVRSGEAALALSERYPEVYAAVGIHPEAAGSAAENDLERIREMARHPRVAAIGEIGLDYYWDRSTAALQQKWFERQLELAAELDLPVCIHDREAHTSVRDTLQRAKERWPHLRGVLHAFSGDLEFAGFAAGLGFKLGFGGPITFKNAREAIAVASVVPLDEIVIETDAPYLAPHPFRGKRNEPAYAALVARRLAELKARNEGEVRSRTSDTARALFRW